MSATTLRAVNQEFASRAIPAALLRHESRGTHEFVLLGTDGGAQSLGDVRIARTKARRVQDWLKEFVDACKRAEKAGAIDAKSCEVLVAKAQPQGKALTPDDLRKWRARMGMTATAAAKELGVTRRTYCEWESGISRNDGRPVVISRAVGLACVAVEAGLVVRAE